MAIFISFLYWLIKTNQLVIAGLSSVRTSQKYIPGAPLWENRSTVRKHDMYLVWTFKIQDSRLHLQG